MDQVQVDVVDAERCSGAFARGKRLRETVIAARQLRGDLDLVSGDSTGRDTAADCLFVAVVDRGVDVPVANVDSGGHRLLGFRPLERVGAEPQRWDLVSIVQLHPGLLRLSERCR